MNPGKSRQKHISGLAIFSVIILLIIIQVQRMSVEHTYCEGEVPVPGQQVNQVGPLNMKDAGCLNAWCGMAPRLQGRDPLF